MKISKQSLIASSVTLAVGVGIGFGVAAGTLEGAAAHAAPMPAPTGIASTAPSATPSTAPTASAADLGNKTQAGANATLNAFFAQLASDVADYEAGLKGGMTNAEKDAVFDAAFQKSLAYLKPESFTAQQRRDITTGFAQFYMYDPKAKIESQPSSYVLSGDTATIKGADFTLTVGGTVQQKAGSSSSSGKLTLTYADGKWLISGYDAGQH